MPIMDPFIIQHIARMLISPLYVRAMRMTCRAWRDALKGIMVTHIISPRAMLMRAIAREDAEQCEAARELGTALFYSQVMDRKYGNEYSPLYIESIWHRAVEESVRLGRKR